MSKDESSKMNSVLYDSFTLITKPEQSGKTFIMLNEIKKCFTDDIQEENGKKVINFIFCDNNLLLTKQTSQRVDSDLKEITIEGVPYIEFSSRKGNQTQNVSVVGYKILMNETQNIICCTNGRRIQDIQQLIRDFNTNTATIEKYFFKIWLDEADKFIRFITKSFIPLASEFENFHCYCMTATPDSLFKKFKGMNVMPLHETVRPDYHGWKDNEIRLMEFTGSSQEFVFEVLDTNIELIKPGTKWYIPADLKKATHKIVSSICVSKNMCVFIVNGDGITLQRPGGEKDVIVEKTDELSNQIMTLYDDYNLKDKAIAITGNICVSRGISIMSEKFMFTHSILYQSCSKKSEDSQRAGRLKGNIKNWGNYRVPIVFTTREFDSIASEWELKSRRLAILAHSQKESGGNGIVSNNDYKNLTKKDKIIVDSKFKLHIREIYESKNMICSGTEMRDFLKNIHRNDLEKKFFPANDDSFQTSPYAEIYSNKDDLIKRIQFLKSDPNYTPLLNSALQKESYINGIGKNSSFSNLPKNLEIFEKTEEDKFLYRVNRFTYDYSPQNEHFHLRWVIKLD